MQTYDSFRQFWNEHSQTKPEPFKFDEWSIVQLLHLNDEEYAQARSEGKDELGFQPLSITFANPFTHESKKVLVKNVNDKVFNEFINYYGTRFLDQLDN